MNKSEKLAVEQSQKKEYAKQYLQTIGVTPTEEEIELFLLLNSTDENERTKGLGIEITNALKEEPYAFVKSATKPNLDYYDNIRDRRNNGSEVPYQGRYGKFSQD